jgi:transglutaminase-like putative cysteine protease
VSQLQGAWQGRSASARSTTGIGQFIARAVDLLLLLVVVLSPAYAMQTVHLDPRLPFGMLVWVASAGILVGLVFALTELPGEIVHPLATIGGALGGLITVAEILPDAPPDAGLGERIGDIESQVASWVQVIATGGQATNNLLFLLLLCVISWIIGYYSAWAVFRERSAWWAVTVSATALTLVLATFPDLYGYMVIQLVAAMLLVGRVNLEARQLRWNAAGFRQPGGLGGRAFWASMALALVLVVLTWVGPSLLGSPAFTEGLGRADRPWEAAQTEFNRLFGGLQAQDQASLSGFSRALTLHGSFHLADTPVLKVAASQPAYWRAMVFDQYTSHGWLSTDPVDQRRIPAGSDLLRPADAKRTDLTQQVTVLTPRGNYLVGASQPVIFSQSVVAQAYPDAPSRAIDLVSAQSTSPIANGTQYSVVSQVSTATAADLRAAGRSYPAEVQRRYVPLPVVPDRVRQLALRLTTPYANPYDKAVAVETYLRSLPYSLDIPAPPPDRDGVDFFLFDVGSGYCDYFASAMAVMLRSVGVPARVVSGYATGEPQGDGTFLIKDSDSHTWTEVYFPGYGWIPFEPSGSWPHFDRGDANESPSTPTPQAAQPTPRVAQSQSQATPTPSPTPTPPDDLASQTQPDTQQPPDLRPFLPFLIALAVLALLALLAWYLWEKDLRGLPPTVVAYAKMTRLAGLLGFGIQPGDTPDTYGQALTAALPEAGPNPARIADGYAKYRFGHRTAEPDDRPIQLWRFVRNALLWRIGRLRR